MEVENNVGSDVRVNITAKSDYLSKDDCRKLVIELEETINTILSQPEGHVEFSSGHCQRSTTEKKDLLPQPFAWTREAKNIREVLSQFAQVETAEIYEDISIFEIGLDSIEVIKLSSRLKIHKIILPVSTIMRNPTIRKMVDALDKDKKGSSGQTSEVDVAATLSLSESLPWDLKLRQDDIEGAYPTTPLQEGMVSQTIISDYKHYFNYDVWRVGSSTKPKHLLNAVRKVIQSNDILRTVFFRYEDEQNVERYGQAVTRYDYQETVVIDISDTGKIFDSLHAGLKAAKESVMHHLAINPEKRDSGLLFKPPIAFCHFKTKTSEESFILFSISHALYDGWSLGLLHDDIKDAYHGKYKPRRPSYIPYLRTVVDGNSESAKFYWAQLLSDAQPTSFPILRNSKDSAEPSTVRHEKTSALSFSKIQTFCKRHSLSPLALGQTVWALLLAHCTQSKDVLFGTVFSGRDDEVAEQVMFPLMNTVVVRSAIEGSFGDCLMAMQEGYVQAREYQYTPLREVQNLARKGTLFDTLFIYQARGRKEEEEPLWTSVGGSSDVEVSQRLDGEECTLTFSSTAFA